MSVAEDLATRIAATAARSLPSAVRRKCQDLLVDVAGLCLAARKCDYVMAAFAGWDEDGRCSAIGHARKLSAAGAAFVNGTAAHGEDFDDTFEGGPVHAGAVIVPFSLVSPFVGHEFILKAFVIAVLGGLGSVGGALAGGLLIGFVEALSSLYISASLGNAIVFAILIAVLLYRPWGIFGQAKV